MSCSGEFIDSLGPWQIFITLTFRRDISERKAHIKFRDYCRAVTKRIGEHLDIAWSWGPQQSGRIHFHTVLKTQTGFARALTKDDFAGIAWPGDVKIEFLRDQAGTSYYLAKREHKSWEVNVTCPRWAKCKKPRYKVAPYPWPTPGECMAC